MRSCNSPDSRLGIPAYAYPHRDSAFWIKLAKAAPALGLVVANPWNGPGTAPDPNYIAAIALVKSRGAAVFGYISTSYATRDVNEVLLDLARWYDWYPTDGVFFDEVSVAEESWAYYQALSASVRARDAASRIVFNPGAQVTERYMGICDVLLNFEGTWATYRDAYEDNPAWVARYSPMRFWHVVHTCPTTAAMRRALDLARARNAGWLFVTTGSGPNPYDRLPGGRYWIEEMGWTSAN